MAENSAINRRSFVTSVAAVSAAGGVAAATAPAGASGAIIAQAAQPKQQQFLTTLEIIALAKKTMTPDLWRFVSGGAESETTLLRNRLGLDSLEFMPNVFEDVSNIDTSTMYLGHKLRIPVVIAPIVPPNSRSTKRRQMGYRSSLVARRLVVRSLTASRPSSTTARDLRREADTGRLRGADRA